MAFSLEPRGVPEPAGLAVGVRGEPAGPAVGVHGSDHAAAHHNPPPQPAVAPPGHDQARYSGEDEYPSNDLEVEE